MHPISILDSIFRMFNQSPWHQRALGQHWFKSWFVAWRHQAITWTDANVSSIRPQEYISVKFYSQIIHSIQKCICKCCLQNGSHFVQVSTCWLILIWWCLIKLMIQVIIVQIMACHLNGANLILSNLWYKTHKIPKPICFSSRFAVVFAQFTKARC